MHTKYPTRWLRYLLSLPTWIVVNAMWFRLPVTHVWKLSGRRFTLRDWMEHSTDLNIECGAVLLISVYTLCAVLARLVFKF